jgi:hypothetical protein
VLIPVSIFLILLGGTLAFAVRWQPPLFDLPVIGWTFMVVGLAGLILHGYVTRRRREAAQISDTAPAPLYDHPGVMPTDMRDPRADD